jgi:hypothetical protein
MQNITSVAGLKNAIQILEAEQADRGQLLKEQFHITYESLKPVNLFRSTIHDITTSPYLIENIVGTALGLATGYLSKKIVIGASTGVFRKLLGSVLQFGITNLVAQHPEAIKSAGQSIFQHIFRKKEPKLSEEDQMNES